MFFVLYMKQEKVKSDTNKWQSFEYWSKKTIIDCIRCWSYIISRSLLSYTGMIFSSMANVPISHVFTSFLACMFDWLCVKYTDDNKVGQWVGWSIDAHEDAEPLTYNTNFIRSRHSKIAYHYDWRPLHKLAYKLYSLFLVYIWNTSE